MDRTEAHDWLCRLRSDFYIYMGGRIPEEGIKSFREALDFAISSIKTDEAYQLEFEKPGFCEDCISREQAKAAIRDKFKDLPSRVEINTILNELTPVTPQEPVIDKIRAEIEQLSPYNKFTGASYTAYEFKPDVLQIIDKYKAESEDT